MNQLTNLQTRLKDPSLLVTKGYLAGEWTDGENSATFEVINPSKGDVIANVADFSRAQVAEAISRADVFITYPPLRRRYLDQYGVEPDLHQGFGRCR